MAWKSRTIVGGLALTAVMIGAFSVESIGAWSQERPKLQQSPVVQVNRSAKGDRLAVPQTIAVKGPAEAPVQPLPASEQTDKRRIMDGCEPAFSSVTVPQMAHIAGRCIG